MDCYLPPYASAELGAMYWQNGQDDKALKQYEHTLTQYSKYGLESRLHFRIHGSVELIKERKGKTEDKVSKKSSDMSSNGDEEYFDVIGDFDDISVEDSKASTGTSPDAVDP